MRRLLVLVALILTVGLASPALAAEGWEDVRDILVAPPPGFVEANEPGMLNGKIDMNQLFEMSGQDAPDDLSDEDLEELNESGYARTLVNAEQGDVLVIMGFRANEDDEAGFMVRGMLDSTAGNADLERDEAASTDDIHVYTLDSADADGQAAVIRKGKYAFMFLVAGQYPDAHKNLAKNLAAQQLQALPAGSTAVGEDDNSGAMIALVIVGLLVVAVVVLIVVRASKRAKQAEAERQAESAAPGEQAGLAEGAGGVHEPGTEDRVGAGGAEVGSGIPDPLAGGGPSDADRRE